MYLEIIVKQTVESIQGRRETTLIGGGGGGGCSLNRPNMLFL